MHLSLLESKTASSGEWSISVHEKPNVWTTKKKRERPSVVISSRPVALLKQKQRLRLMIKLKQQFGRVKIRLLAWQMDRGHVERIGHRVWDSSAQLSNPGVAYSPRRSGDRPHRQLLLPLNVLGSAPVEAPSAFQHFFPLYLSQNSKRKRGPWHKNCSEITIQRLIYKCKLLIVETLFWTCYSLHVWFNIIFYCVFIKFNNIMILCQYLSKHIQMWILCFSQKNILKTINGNLPKTSGNVARDLQ